MNKVTVTAFSGKPLKVPPLKSGHLYRHRDINVSNSIYIATYVPEGLVLINLRSGNRFADADKNVDEEWTEVFDSVTLTPETIKV